MKVSSVAVGLGCILVGHAQALGPVLKETFGVGAGVGGQHYNGSFGEHTTIYGRGFLTYNPLEWLGTRVTAGYGDLSCGRFETDWFSNVGVELVLQPKIEGLGGFRPFVAAGFATTFGTATVDKQEIYDLDWNAYLPAEAGLEFLFNQHVSVWVWAETYVNMQKGSRLDGVQSPGGYFTRRDDLYKTGLGITVRFGAILDADKDGIADGDDRCPATPAGVLVSSKGCPLDGDGDGIPNFKDKCLSTPALALVDADGCLIDTDKDGVSNDFDRCQATPAGVLVDTAGCPLDADKDGVPNYIDQCANTQAGLGVDRIGCPLKIDTDKDGVYDDKDHCIDTPVGAQVDAVGCSISVDADKDGVQDGLDKCPGTSFGDKVDSTGCVPIVIVKGVKLVLYGIEFKTGSAEIEAVSVPVLTRAAQALARSPEAKVEIAGFTDNVGKSAGNKRLSQKRAESVAGQLVKLGAGAKQLTAVGYGSAQPIADNKTSEGRAQNRRIEFRVK